MQLNNLPKQLIKSIIILYRFTLGYFFPPDSCRFYPSCSQYALESVEKYGTLKGLIKSIYRIIRCNPWNKGGYDPV
ncbi:MAG: membrane protein insertion efficiency factor YidD [candidate division Zixibacteria bacterium]|nr:membrane protein insertion efficiency factor YidD [candidate division Zixibacteria bacterium]